MIHGLKKILKRKRALRGRLEAKSFTEKLRLLEALRERELSIIATRAGLPLRGKQ